MKFLYACDIHGEEDKYNTLLQVAIDENYKFIVLGGDLLPKYCSDRFNEQKIFIEDFLNDYFTRLEKNKITCICILGNDDLEILDECFNNMCKKHKNIWNIDNKKIDIEDISFIGLSKVLDHPFGCKDRVVIENGNEMDKQLSSIIYVEKNQKMLSVEEWEKYRNNNIEKMENILAKLPEISKDKKTIYVFHNPPYGIDLDVCYNRRKVGSKAMVDFIGNSNAYMSLHGHIHESPMVSGSYISKLNNTICLQPGQSKAKSHLLLGLKIDTELNEIKYLIKECIEK